MMRERQARIAEQVQRTGSVRVSDLARDLAVSEVTIRNDLARLEKEGLLARDHGGAIRPSARQVTSLAGIEFRAGVRTEEKRRIGAEAARLVEPGDTILIDAGTTAVEMTRFLGDVAPLTIVTHAVNVALAAAETQAQVILLGGQYSRESASNLGPLAERSLADLLIDKLFLGVQAIDFEHGLTDTTPEIAQMKRAMIRASRKVLLVADSTKWNSSGFIKVAPLSSLHGVISDKGTPEDVSARLADLGIGVTLV